ncbi:MAG TPA: hypothetical protein VFV34_15630, partial [Blastocatellia bacterium]|nr:hypothetical protein [Blastocatellia bacterium]
MSDKWIMAAASVTLIGMAIYMVSRRLISRRPFVIRGTLIASLATVVLLLVVVLETQILSGKPNAVGLVWAGFIVWNWWILRGYVVVGVSREHFERGLQHAAEELQLETEKRKSDIRLLVIGGEIRTKFEPLMGNGYLNIVPFGRRKMLRQIAQEFDRFLDQIPARISWPNIIFNA